MILFDGNLIRIGDLLLRGIIVSSSSSRSNLINDLVPSDQVVVNLRLISLTDFIARKKKKKKKKKLRENSNRIRYNMINITLRSTKTPHDSPKFDEFFN